MGLMRRLGRVVLVDARRLRSLSPVGGEVGMEEAELETG
jgi:hypothetical protein